MPAHSKTRNRRIHAYILLLINTICWGAALPIVKPALSITTPFRYLLYRYAIVSILSFPILIYYWPKIKKKVDIIALIALIEMFGSVLGLIVLYYGLSMTTAIEASLLGITTPIFTTLACILFLREREEKHEWLGMGLAFLSTILLTLFPLLQHGGKLTLFSQTSLVGNSLIILQNIISALYMVLAKKYYHRLPKFFVTTIGFWVVAVSFFFLSFIESHLSLHFLWQNIQYDWLSPSVWLAAIYMAVFGSLIGLTTYFKGQDEIEASEASLFMYLQPLVFVPLSVFFLKENFSWVQAVLFIGVFVGVFISEKRVRK